MSPIFLFLKSEQFATALAANEWRLRRLIGALMLRDGLLHRRP
jgi:hypothetical protein